jgi:hypothetical protein
VSSMSNNNNSCVDVSKAAFLAARRAWPGRGRDDLLTAPVHRVYDSWMAVSEEDRLIALDAVVLEGLLRTASGQGLPSEPVSGLDAVGIAPSGVKVGREPTHGGAGHGDGGP